MKSSERSLWSRTAEERAAPSRLKSVARARPDGYTLFMAALPQIAILPAIRKTPYDPVKDFEPISIIATNPFVLVVNKDFPGKTLAGFVSLCSRSTQRACLFISGCRQP